MRITPINYQSRNYSTKAKNNNTNFQGMTKILKNRIYLDGQKDIAEIMAKREGKMNVVGQLPEMIFRKLPKENRGTAIREILGVFDNITNVIRDFEPNAYSSIDEITNKRPKIANEQLNNVLRKYKVIAAWDDDVDIQYVDAGGKGKVYKLQNLRDYKTEDEFVIKVFHLTKNKNWQPYKSHGNYAELNNAIYWRTQEGHDTHRGKFFFGSLDSGYLVSKFIDEDTRLPKRRVDEYKYGIKCTDEAKDGPVVGYNLTKGYNYDYGGMRVVNRLKNGDKVARKYLEIIRNTEPKYRPLEWFRLLHDDKNSESKKAGLALGIKYLEDKNSYIDMCLKMNSPKVNQALAYVLKYLPHHDAVQYFEKLVNTDDSVTQVILFNEIPLLSKYKKKNIEMKDDINATLAEIIPDRVYKYYKIAEQYAKPDTIEHLASFIHLLPMDRIPFQYLELAKIQNYALQDRLIWKFPMLPNEYADFAVTELAKHVKNKDLQAKLLKTCMHDISDEANIMIRNLFYEQRV